MSLLRKVDVGVSMSHLTWDIELCVLTWKRKSDIKV
jgi:hypothetical protein